MMYEVLNNEVYSILYQESQFAYKKINGTPHDTIVKVNDILESLCREYFRIARNDVSDKKENHAGTYSETIAYFLQNRLIESEYADILKYINSLRNSAVYRDGNSFDKKIALDVFVKGDKAASYLISKIKNYDNKRYDILENNFPEQYKMSKQIQNDMDEGDLRSAVFKLAKILNDLCCWLVKAVNSFDKNIRLDYGVTMKYISENKILNNDHIKQIGDIRRKRNEHHDIKSKLSLEEVKLMYAETGKLVHYIVREINNAGEHNARIQKEFDESYKRTISDYLAGAGAESTEQTGILIIVESSGNTEERIKRIEKIKLSIKSGDIHVSKCQKPINQGYFFDLQNLYRCLYSIFPEIAVSVLSDEYNEKENMNVLTLDVDPESLLNNAAVAELKRSYLEKQENIKQEQKKNRHKELIRLRCSVVIQSIILVSIVAMIIENILVEYAMDSFINIHEYANYAGHGIDLAYYFFHYFIYPDPVKRFIFASVYVSFGASLLFYGICILYQRIKKYISFRSFFSGLRIVIVISLAIALPTLLCLFLTRWIMAAESATLTLIALTIAGIVIAVVYAENIAKDIGKIRQIVKTSDTDQE